MKRSALGRRIRSLDSFDSTCFRLCAYYFSGYDYFRFPELYRYMVLHGAQQRAKRELYIVVYAAHPSGICHIITS